MKTAVVALALSTFACDSPAEPVDARTSSGQGCSFGLTEQVPEPPPAELLGLVRACEADARQCEALCQRILDNAGHASDFLDSCMVDNTPTGHTVKVGYHLLCAD